MMTMRQLLRSAGEGTSFCVLGAPLAESLQVTAVRLVQAGSTMVAPSTGELQVVVGNTAQNWWWDALIRRIRDARAAGLVTAADSGLGESADHLAKRLGVTIVQVLGEHDRILDFAVALGVHLAEPALHDAQIFDALEQAERRHHQLPIQSVLDRMAALARAPVFLIADGGPVLVYSGDAPPSIPARWPGSSGLSRMSTAEGSLFVARPFAVAGEHYGLIAQMDADAPAHAVRRAERVLSIGAVHAARWYAEQQLEGQVADSTRDAILEQVFSGQEQARALEHRAAELGIGYSGANLPFFVTSGSSFYGVKDILLRGLRAENLSTAVVPRNEGWACWVQFPRTASPARVKAGVTSLRRAYARISRDVSISMGIGRLVQGANELRDSLAEARDAAKLAASRPAGRRFVRVEGLGAAALLLSWTQSAPFLPRATQVLQPLDTLSDAHRTTVLTFLDHSMSVTDTAAALGVHRNTIRTRVARVREVLNVDLDDRDERLALHLALRAVASG
ncbi:helix-turn-helix domain-containing protein [Brevibacterium sp.]|nr:helix-turn-helix domain-containing protein [Brevibacterium sp.]